MVLPRLEHSIICVVGLGYVGLPTAIAFHNSGFSVIGVDVSTRVIRELDSGRSPLVDTSANLEIPNKSSRWEVTSEFGSAVSRADVVLITVPTPVNKDNTPDLNYVISASSSVIENLDTDRTTIVVLESTVYPGVTRSVIGGLCDEKGLTQGEEVVLAYCPERINPGEEGKSINSVAQIVGCDYREVGSFLAELFGKITDEGSFYVGRIEVAEASKMVENVQRDIDIALANELAIVLPRLGIDVEDVLSAASTKWNFHRHTPGIGVGGHCIPVDPYYYMNIAKEAGFPSSLSASAREINNGMPEIAANEIFHLMGGQSNSKVLVLGYAYKAEVGDVRETPVRELTRHLEGNGCEVLVWDPLVKNDELPPWVNGVDDPYDCHLLDAVVLATAHREILDIDWKRIMEACRNPLIYDGRRALDRELLENMGWKFAGIGAHNFSPND
jgi:nucleotide sugar dehydrogenase